MRVVHHCLVYEGGGLMGLDGFFAGYVPGYEAAEFPSGTGKLLRKGATLTFQMHYITTGRVESDQTRIGLYVAPTPPQYALQTKSAFNIPFVLGQTEIPPGANDFEISAQYPVPTLGSPTLPTNILLYEMSPHMHLRGSRFRYEALYPNGTREVLLSVPRYEFHWQTLYRLAQPKFIPAGSRIICTGAWDNSARNHANPDPSATVSWGDQTDDEMFIGYFNFAEVP
jgi:copper type II ascorbate-dependent monooxygenase-like protein